MSYVSAIAVDFGSTNSGCCRVCEHDSNGELIYANPEFLHSIGDYAKDNTWFYVEESFLQRIRTSYSSIKDEEFRIVSRIFPNTPQPNIICGREAIQQNYSLISNGNWKAFKRFKMMLYRGDGNYTGLDFPLVLIIKVYLRIIKLECLALESKRIGRPVDTDEVQWGVTIPTIWSDANKGAMSDIVKEVFNSSARILSEPEGPLVYSLQASNAQGKLEYVDGRISLVIDMGGGTTDICVMKEVKQGSDAGYKLEMVAGSDGSAAGGNDIDEAFFIYLLRDLSKGLTSDSGVAYDSLSDYDLVDTLLSGFQDNIQAWIAMENNWYSYIKNRADFNSISECPFELNSDYRRWLINNGHTKVASRVGEYLMDGCSFQKDSLVAAVFTPTFDKICAKVREVIASVPAGMKIDRVVLAGGLSCNYQLKSRLRNTLIAELGSSIESSISDMGVLKAGGAIAAGACYILLNRDAIIRIAKWDRNYFYDTCVMKITDHIVDKYASFGYTLKRGHVSSYMEEEEEYRLSSGTYGTLILSPIALKDKLIQNYVNDRLYTSEGQTTLQITLYSSEKDVVIYANEDNPALRIEKEIEIDCRPDTRYKLEVDFNEASISNSLHYRLIELETGKVVADDSIDDTFSYKDK